VVEISINMPLVWSIQARLSMISAIFELLAHDRRAGYLRDRGPARQGV